jgi:hypothetical protein
MALVDAIPSAVAVWTLDESSGTRIDSIGSSDLTDNNTVGVDAGKFGNAADFIAANDEYLSVADNADLSMGDVDFTIRFWAKLNNVSSRQDLVAKWDPDDGREYIVTYNTSTNRFTLFVSSDGTSSTSVNLAADNFGAASADTWYLIHAWHDSVNNELGISVNAGTPDTEAHSLGVFDGSENFQLGRRSGTTNVANMDGALDDVVILKGYVLDSTERTEDYNGGAGIAFAQWGANPMYYYQQIQAVCS